MLLTLIGKNSINRLILPQKIAGNYWLYNKDCNPKRKLINVEAVNDNWQIRSTQNCKIINGRNISISNNSINISRNGEEILDKIILKNYNFYCVTIGDNNEVFLLYCCPLYENNYSHLCLKNTSTIFIGKNPQNNHIIYNNPFVSNIHVKICLLNNNWMLENYDKRFNTYINDKPVSDTVTFLSNGDRISILGLNIIFMNNELIINNPLNRVSWNNNYFTLNDYSNNKLLKTEDEQDFKAYVNDNYFLRPPRIWDLVEEVKITIAPPNNSPERRELPILLVLGSTLSMATMTIISIAQTLDNFLTGNTTKKNAIFSLLMSSGMLLTAILIPVISKQYSEKINKLNKEDVIKNYRKYIKAKLKTIEETLDNTRSILYKTYVSSEECANIILNDRTRLWERKISDGDFLTVRLGIGDIKSNIKISNMAGEKIEENTEEYNLMLECVEKSKTIKDAPVLLSLTQKNISAILYKTEGIQVTYVQNLLLQLVAFHSYDELKIVFLLKNNLDKKWDFVKMLPHVWSNSKDIRFFLDEHDKIIEISKYLEEEFNKREKLEVNKRDYKDNIPYYLIISDDYKMIEDLELIKEILNQEQNLGFSIMFLANNITSLPNECQTFINIEGRGGTLFESRNVNENKLDFKIDTSQILFFNQISSILSNISIKYNDEKEMLLPSSYSFLEMYNVGCIEQLNILERWKNNDSTLSLGAPIGIDGKGNHISLDIHEKFHGPHGLIAGSTGSGKSEFIITYILSLAVNYHPDDVTFVLIDYKGGGLAGAFKRPDVELPHLVGTITNIDKSSLQRSLESIESELKRRQVEFNEARIVTGESTIDIYKYQKYYHAGVLKKPISHLFIISDEFAELKQQEPEFMDELISVARIGRSLGVHLILATQKPAGVVNDQIRSNSKFGVCLKVQSTSDSKDIIDLPDAAKLKGAGQFYLKVGNDDYLALGQSAWSGALYYPSNEVKKEYDNSIEFISDTGMILKKVDDTKNKSNSKGEQVTNLVKFISDLAKEENIHEDQLWLDPIPETIYLEEVREKYKVKTEKNIINPVIGEYDDPSKQLQKVMTLNLSKDGNVIIYGNAESGKETLLSTMIYDIITKYSTEETWLYILDFGSEVMKIFKKAAHVGDVILANESEKLARFFMMLQKELKERKEILSDYNGDYNLYLKSSGNIMPTYVIVMNNFESFTENYPNIYDDVIEVLLREGTKYGFVFVFSVNTVTGIRYRTLQNFRQKIALQMNKDDDYTSIFERLGKKRPSRLFGRGIVNPEPKKYYEYQTARICKPEVWNECVQQAINEINKKNNMQAKEIPVVPEMVTINYLESSLKGLSNFPIGVSQKNITHCTIDLCKNMITQMIANNLEEFKDFILNIVEELKMLPDIDFVVLDAENIIMPDKKENLTEKYIRFFGEVEKSEKKAVCIIIGVDKFIATLGNEEMFGASLDNAEELNRLYYIIMDNPSKLNNHNASEWYKKYLTRDNGIWLGNGAGEQYILKSIISTFKFINTCGISYGYVFTKGKPSLTKLLGMKEKGEENE